MGEESLPLSTGGEKRAAGDGGGRKSWRQASLFAVSCKKVEEKEDEEIDGLGKY